uniref:protein kinase domain-containing protein n=1 Tax=uncultured Endozoicomonas sp. TaxID=432652 RepID=UPI00262D5EC8
MPTKRAGQPHNNISSNTGNTRPLSETPEGSTKGYKVTPTLINRAINKIKDMVSGNKKSLTDDYHINVAHTAKELFPEHNGKLEAFNLDKMQIRENLSTGDKAFIAKGGFGEVFEVAMNSSDSEKIQVRGSDVFLLNGKNGQTIPLNNLVFKYTQLNKDEDDSEGRPIENKSLLDNLHFFDQESGEELLLTDLSAKIIDPKTGHTTFLDENALSEAIKASFKAEVGSPGKLQRQTVVKDIKLSGHQAIRNQQVNNIQYEIDLQNAISSAPKIRGGELCDEDTYRIAMDNGGYELSSLLSMALSNTKKGQQYAVSKHATKLPEDQVRALGRQMLKQLRDVHATGICHRDIKPKNILIDNKGCIKLVDFGLAKYDEQALAEPEKPIFTGYSGTLSYLPPELVMTGEQSLKGDVWAMGLTLIEMLTGWTAKLVKEKNNQLTFDQEMFWDFSHDVLNKSGISKDARELILNMIKEDPAKRMTARDALKLPFFTPPPVSEMSVFELQITHDEALNDLISSEVALQEAPDDRNNQLDVRYYQRKVISLQRCIELREQINLFNRTTGDQIDYQHSEDTHQSEIKLLTVFVNIVVASTQAALLSCPSIHLSGL